jgi:hypothetical protein
MKRQRGRRHGAAMAVWFFFADLFEPRKAAAIEHIDTAARIGSEAERRRATAAGQPDPLL